MAYRKLTVDVRAKINDLVDVIKSFLPLTSYSNHRTTFYTIFKESRIQNYLDSKKLSKVPRLQKGFRKLYQQHRNLPKTIIRKVVVNGIEYRKFNRKPIHQEEIDRLIKILSDLNIDMKDELESIELDDSLPIIQIPPEELVRRLDDHPLVGYFGHMVPVISEQIVPLSIRDITS